jgi:hypothetical protein
VVAGADEVVVSGPVTLSGTIDTTGGSIRMGGFFWTQGGFAGDGSATVGGTVTVTTTSQKTASLGFVNEGTLLWGGGNLIVPENAVVVNEGVWDFQNTFTTSMVASPTQNDWEFVNWGLLTKTPGSTSTMTLAGSFTNQTTGTVDAQTGTFSLSRVAAMDAGSSVSAQDGGTVTLTGAPSPAPGVVSGVGVSVAGSGVVNWNGSWVLGLSGDLGSGDVGSDRHVGWVVVDGGVHVSAGFSSGSVRLGGTVTATS